MLLRKLFNNSSNITRNDICTVLTQFSFLMQAGVPILQALETMEQCQSKLSLRRMLLAIRNQIVCGVYLSQAFKSYEMHFDLITLYLIEIGERSGKLDTMLMIINKRHERSNIIRKKIQNALIYPIILIATSFSMLLFMILCIIPKFASLYAETNTALPLITTFIFNLSRLAQQSTWGVIPICVFSFILMKYKYIPSPKQYWLQSKWNKKIRLTFFIRNLAHTLCAGLPLIDAIQLASNKLFDVTDMQHIPLLIKQIKNGMSLHAAMQVTSFFPAIVIQMIKIGEECGKLDDMLHKCADLLEAEIDNWIATLSKLVEPLIMVVLGALIGGLVIAMYLPIFKLGTLF